MGLTFTKERVPDPRVVRGIAERLIAAEAEVAKLKEEWSALFGASGDEDAARGTLSDRIVELLNSRSNERFNAAQVTSLLNANPNSVGPLLSRLVSEQKIAKVGHGEYRSLGYHLIINWSKNMDEVKDAIRGLKSPEAQES